MFKKMLLSVVTIITFLVLFHPKSFGQDKPINISGDKPSAPMEVELYFSSEPILNQNTTLNFKVTLLQDAPDTSIKFDIPREGFIPLSGNTELTESLSSGETKIYKVDVMPLSFGQYKITASAVSTNGTYVFGKTAELYVILDEKGTKVSQTNIFAGETISKSESEKIGDISQQLIHIPLSDKPNQVQNSSEFIVPGPGQIAVRGFWYYRDKNNVDRVLRDARVEIWDLDTFSSDDLLYTTYTNNSGYYESGNISNTGDEAGGQDIYVKVYTTDNFSVRVTDLSGNLYFSQTPTISNVPDGYVDAGSYSVTDANNRMSYYIYDKIANDAYDYLVNNASWVNSYNLQIRWTSTSSTGTYYSPGGSIDLVAGDRWDIDVFFHEYGHFVMYKIYGNTLPPGSGCTHTWGTHNNLGCAWTEGWADFLQAAIQNDRFYDDTEDQTLHIDYEPPTPVAHHAEDEGAVAASLWDIFDSGTESWDSLNNGIGSSNSGIWKISSINRPNDAVQFYNSWNSSTNGFNSEMTSILQHHDIIPNPVLTASLNLSPSGPYVVGQTVTGRFSITNRGNRSITFEMLTIGGRLNGDTTVVDFPAQTNITLSSNQTYNYVGNFTFTQTGNYRFFPAYRLAGNVWRIGLLNEIPADPGVIYNLNFNVSSNTIPVTVQTSPSGRSFTVDGTTYTSAQTFNWTSGSSHSIGTTSPQSGATGVQYVWSSWSNGGAITQTVSPTTSATYTANFATQYFLTMNSGTGGTVSPSSNWYNSGQNVSISATPNGGYSFGGWTGSGSGSYTGPNNPANVMMNGPVTETASFAQNAVQITVGTNPAGRSFTVDGNTYTSVQSFLWIPGSIHTISTTSPQSGGTGIQYLWSNWSDGGSISHTVVAPNNNATYTANFITQYFLTMTAGAGGNVSPSSGWYNSGQIVGIQATPNSGFNFTGWAGSGNGSYTGANNPANVTMNGPVTETASFAQNAVQITVGTNPAGRSFTVDGTTYTSAQTFNWTSGSSHSIGTTSPQSGATGVQYVWSSWSNGGAITQTVSPTTSATYTANFATQYFLTMNSGTGGTVSPSSNWYNSGQNVSISATPNGGYSFGGWTGSGSGSYTGANNPANVTMNAPISETANFTQNPTFISVTVGTNPSGRSFTVDSTTYTSTQTFNWTSGSSHSISTTSPQSGGAGIQYVWSNWSDSGSISHDVSPTSNTTYTANFTTQYFLTMNTNPANGGTVNLPSGWYNSGQQISISATPNSGFNFSGWTGNYTGPNNPATITMNTLMNQTANFSQTPPGRKPFDYDGDGKSDVSVFRPSENKWYILQSSNSAVVQKVFAVAGDIPAPADYDGDGKTDIAIFRPSSGDWWYLSSINSTQINVHFGQSGDIPRPSDFDGDGKSDFIVYRPSNSVWYRFGSTGVVQSTAFGIAEDKPLIGDFDGDGKSDLAIFRPSTGDWWYAASASGGVFRATHWGQSGDIPVPADYDGDGKTDFAVFRPSDGGWYILKSSDGSFITTAFGLSGDKPVAADYDGDGKADIAVFRPSTGIWYLLQTTAGFGGVQWGISTDIPTENAFLP